MTGSHFWWKFMILNPPGWGLNNHFFFKFSFRFWFVMSNYIEKHLGWYEKLAGKKNSCLSPPPYFRGRQVHCTVQYSIYYPSTDQAGLFAKGEIRQNIKFAAFWCVFLTKIKVDPESWWKILYIKQLRKKKMPKDNLTWSRSKI